MSKHPVRSGVEAFASIGQGLPSRHRLTPEEVAKSQRNRIVVAFLQVTAEGRRCTSSFPTNRSASSPLSARRPN